MNLVRFCRNHSRAVFLLTGALTIAGVVALFQLPSNIYPELNFPRVVVLVHAGDLSPDAMLLTVTRPIEEQVSTVFGVRRVRSRTIRGGAEISVSFADNMDMQLALQLVQAKVNDARTGLPADAEIQVERLTPTVWPILSLILNGNVPDADLRDYAFYNLRPVLTRVPGVAVVDVEATDTREISVIIDPQKALAHKLTLPEIADRLRATNTVASVGKLDANYQQFLILTNSQYKSVEDIGATALGNDAAGAVLLRDVATVRVGTADRKTLITGNGRPAAVINVTRQIGGNIISVSQQVKDLAFHSQNIIPATLHISTVYDLAEFVQESMGSVRDAILIGSILAVVILFIFLRNLRITIVAAVSLPLTVAATFFFVKLLGGTLNLMSLGGIAIAIGLVIDDAVVIVENIYRHIGAGESVEEAAEKGTRELIGPVIGSTLTTVVVFLPLGFLKGAVGNFFAALSMTLTASVMISLLYSLTLIPVLAEYLLLNSKFRESSSRFIEPVNRTYERGIRWALANRLTVGIVAAILIVVAGVAYWRLGTGFLPEMDEGGFVLDYITPAGTSLTETDSLVRQMEAKVAAVPEMSAFSRRTGHELGLFATEQNKGDILVKLKPPSQRKRSIDEVMNDLRTDINKSVAGLESIEFIQILQDMLGDLEGSPEPVEVKIFGSDSKELVRIANEVQPRLAKIPGLVDSKGPQSGNPELLVNVDSTLAAHVGLTVDQVSQQLRDGLLGDSPTDLRQGDRLIPIRLRYPDSFRGEEQNIRQFPIVTSNKQIVPLESLGTITKDRGQSQLLRENQRLMVVLSARLENLDLGSGIVEVKKVLSTVKLPVGYTYEIGGQYESQQSSFHDLLSVLGLALAAVFTVLVIQFRAFLPALVILSAAPMSMIGVFVLLLVTGTPLNVSSFMGIILMVGLVVKNGIILFEYFERLEEGDLSVTEALVQAGRIRLRPILMTTLCTLFGLLPLALGLGAGAELQKPLAIAVIGGLSISTLITLIAIPVFYSAIRRRAPAAEN